MNDTRERPGDIYIAEFDFKYLKDIADRVAGMSRLSAVDAL